MLTFIKKEVPGENMSKFTTCKRSKEIYDLVRNCTTEEFLKNWRQWFTEILSSFENSAYDFSISTSKKASCLILDEFFRVSARFPAVAKEISAEKMQILIPKLTHVNDVLIDGDHVLLALKSCLTFFPAVSGRFATKNIYPYLSKYVDLPLSSTRNLAAHCFSLMPFVGPIGENHLKHQENWLKQLNFLFYTTAQCLNLLTLTNDSSKFSIENIEFLLEMEELTPVVHTDKQFFRLDFCLSSINFMISRSSSFIIQFPLSAFLELFRCFTFAFTSEKFVNSHISSVTKGCASFLNVFSHVPSIVRYFLTPYCSEIFDLLETNLHQTTKSVEFFPVKCSVYKVLKEIAVSLGAASKLHLFLAKFWRYCKVYLQATVSTYDNGNAPNPSSLSFEPSASKRQKTKHRKNDKIDDGDQFVVKRSDIILDKSRKCLISCAEMLTVAFERVGVATKPELYRNVQQFVCQLILKIQLRTSVGDVYNDPKCRLSVYCLLRSLVLCQHPHCPSAVQCAIQIFNDGAQDDDRNVANFCVSTLHIVNNIIKPRVPYLESVINQTDVSKPVEIEEEEAVTIGAKSSLITNVAVTTADHEDPNANSDDEEEVVVNIDSESDDDDRRMQEEVQIVSQTKKHVQVQQKIIHPPTPHDNSKATEHISSLNTVSDTVVQMISDFVEEPID